MRIRAAEKPSRLAATHLDLVCLRDALGNGNDEGNLCLDGLDDGISSSGGRDVDDGSVRVRLLDGVANAAKDGESKVSLASLLGRDASYELGAVGQGLLAVEGSCASGEAPARARHDRRKVSRS